MQRMLTDDEVDPRDRGHPRRHAGVLPWVNASRRYPSQVAAASSGLGSCFDLGRENLVPLHHGAAPGARERVGALFEASPTAQDLINTITGG